MSWMQRGATVQRNYTDQTQTVTVSNNSITIPFNSLKTLGFLKSLRLYTPFKAQTANAGTALAAPTALQAQQLRPIRHFRLQAQGIAPIYDVDGPDLGYLSYVGNGKPQSERTYRAKTLGYVNTAAGAVNPFVFPQALAAASMTQEKFSPVVEYISGGPTFSMGYAIEIPISEWIVFPNTAVGKAGNAIMVADTQLEAGLLFMQNNQQVITPYVDLAPLYAAAYPAVILTGGGTQTLSATQSWTIESEFYDVPPSQDNWPSPYQLGMVVTRTARDIQVSSGIVSYQFKQAGILLRSIYVFYNDTTTFGTQVDVFADGTATPDLINLELKSGGTITKIKETAQLNGMRSLDRYGDPPPGVLIHDLIWDGFITQAIDTAGLVDVRCDFSGLPAPITRMHVIEERLVPIDVAA